MGLWTCGCELAAELLRQFVAGIAVLGFTRVEWWCGTALGWQSSPGYCGERADCFSSPGFAVRVRVSWGKRPPDKPYSCVVCGSRGRRRQELRPCRHLLCKFCALRLRGKACPICGAKIADVGDPDGGRVHLTRKIHELEQRARNLLCDLAQEENIRPSGASTRGFKRSSSMPNGFSHSGNVGTAEQSTMPSSSLMVSVLKSHGVCPGSEQNSEPRTPHMEAVDKQLAATLPAPWCTSPAVAGVRTAPSSPPAPVSPSVIAAASTQTAAELGVGDAVVAVDGPATPTLMAAATAATAVIARCRQVAAARVDDTSTVVPRTSVRMLGSRDEEMEAPEGVVGLLTLAQPAMAELTEMAVSRAGPEEPDESTETDVVNPHETADTSTVHPQPVMAARQLPVEQRFLTSTDSTFTVPSLMVDPNTDAIPHVPPAPSAQLVAAAPVISSSTETLSVSASTTVVQTVPTLNVSARNHLAPMVSSTSVSAASWVDVAAPTPMPVAASTLPLAQSMASIPEVPTDPPEASAPSSLPPLSGDAVAGPPKVPDTTISKCPQSPATTPSTVCDSTADAATPIAASAGSDSGDAWRDTPGGPHSPELLEPAVHPVVHQENSMFERPRPSFGLTSCLHEPSQQDDGDWSYSAFEETDLDTPMARTPMSCRGSRTWSKQGS